MTLETSKVQPVQPDLSTENQKLQEIKRKNTEEAAKRYEEATKRYGKPTTSPDELPNLDKAYGTEPGVGTEPNEAVPDIGTEPTAPDIGTEPDENGDRSLTPSR